MFADRVDGFRLNTSSKLLLRLKGVRLCNQGSRIFLQVKLVDRPLEDPMEEQQIVYILRNEAMPGLIKIGRTAGDLATRMKQLYTTGVPVPFQCIYAVKVEHLLDVEKTLHFAFGGQRLNENREFFTVEPERVIAVLKLLNAKEVTGLVESSIQEGLTDQDKAAEAELKRKRPVLDFAKLGIFPESQLVFQDGTTAIKVISNRKVEFEGQPCFLVNPTRKLLGLAEDYPIQPSPYWSYQGKRLKDLYEEFHGEQETTE